MDDMIIVRGVNIYPSAVEELIRACPEVSEYRIHIKQSNALAEMQAEIETVAGCTDPKSVAARLEKTFQDAFALRVPVSALPTGALPRFEMKAKRWIKG